MLWKILPLKSSALQFCKDHRAQTLGFVSCGNKKQKYKIPFSSLLTQTTSLTSIINVSFTKKTENIDLNCLQQAPLFL